MTKITYLACPYSDASPEKRAERFTKVTKAAAILQQLGYKVFSPITHSHLIDVIGGPPTDAEYWNDIDMFFLERCSELMILCLKGWKESGGVKREIERAIALQIPMRYIKEAFIEEMLER